jgi:5-methylcytosine-specific restriction endonuclease McrA
LDGRKRVKNIVVDHIKPVVPVEGWVSWDDCIENMFSEEDNLQALCSHCHKIKSGEEAKERAAYRATHKKNPGEYTSWYMMKQRCNNAKRVDYPHYGGRGITYHDLWESFEAFYEDMGERPDGYTLERLDFNSDYTPMNCVWASRREQSNNTSSNVRFTIGENNKTLAQWCDHYGADYKRVRARMGLGWSLIDSLTAPKNTKKCKLQDDGEVNE